MSENHNKVNIRLNTVDEDKHPIKINLVLTEHENDICEANIYDSRFRHFYSMKLQQPFNYYFDLLCNNNLKILYEFTYDDISSYVGHNLLVYIAGGGINDCIGLIQNKLSHDKLIELHKKIRNYEYKLNQLKMEEYKIRNIYP